jgi:hypothetical protein
VGIAGAIPMAGIGALIGNSARTPQEAGSISFLVTFLMFGLGPVVIPPERLPGVVLFCWAVQPGHLRGLGPSASAAGSTDRTDCPRSDGADRVRDGGLLAGGAQDGLAAGLTQRKTRGQPG